MATQDQSPPLIHCIDRCSAHGMAGWSTAPWFDLAINDRPVARITPDIARGDLTEAGIKGAGFDLLFDQTIWFDDVVTLRGPDAITHKTQIDPKSATRLRDMLRHIDPSRQIGLEIGPLDRPLVPKHRFKIYYLDQAPVEQLKARQPAKAKITPLVVPDFAVGDAPFTEIIGNLRFDYAVASHVIEHVPDFVGWLWNIWSVLRETAVLSLAIPHAERSFDARRRRSSFADAAQAFLGRIKQPSPAQIIDAQIGIAAFHNNPDPLKTAFHAFHLANHVRQTGHYVDLHCWVFTPDSFVDILRTLDACGLLGFELLEVIDHGTDEFLVHFAKRPDRKPPANLAL